MEHVVLVGCSFVGSKRVYHTLFLVELFSYGQMFNLFLADDVITLSSQQCIWKSSGLPTVSVSCRHFLDDCRPECPTCPAGRIGKKKSYDVFSLFIQLVSILFLNGVFTLCFWAIAKDKSRNVFQENRLEPVFFLFNPSVLPTVSASGNNF